MKKLPTLHILNGDASLDAFRNTEIQGQVLIWREILSEGPAVSALPENEFWQMRQQYITTTYKEPTEAYKVKVLNEVRKLDQVKAFFEVVLWFDAEMMCQVNLMYLLHKLNQQKPALVSICTPDNLQNIGLLPKDKLQELFTNRTVTQEEELQQATTLWHLYAGPDPSALQEYLSKKEIKLPYLEQALKLHLARFPSCTNGLSKPQQVLLQLMKTESLSLNQLMTKFWQEHPAFGLGDWQLQMLLQTMQPVLVTEQEPLELTAHGLEVLKQNALFKQWVEQEQWLGGVKLRWDTHWCYDNQEGLIFSKS